MNDWEWRELKGDLPWVSRFWNEHLPDPETAWKFFHECYVQRLLDLELLPPLQYSRTSNLSQGLHNYYKARLSFRYVR